MVKISCVSHAYTVVVCVYVSWHVIILLQVSVQFLCGSLIGDLQYSTACLETGENMGLRMLG